MGAQQRLHLPSPPGRPWHLGRGGGRQEPSCSQGGSRGQGLCYRIQEAQRRHLHFTLGASEDVVRKQPQHSLFTDAHFRNCGILEARAPSKLYFTQFPLGLEPFAQFPRWAFKPSSFLT